MSQAVFRVAGFSMVAMLLILTVKRDHGDLAAALSLAACVVVCTLVFALMDPILDLLRELAEAARLNADMIAPLYKAVGIGLLTQITAAACQDAGQQALAAVTQIIVFAKGLTPFPKWCAVFSIVSGLMVIIIMKIIGNYPFTNALSTSWISLGSIWTFGGLLINLKGVEKS